MCVSFCPNQLIVYYAQTIILFVFHHKIDFMRDKKRILNFEGHHIHMIGSKVTAVLITKKCFVHIAFFWAIFASIWEVFGIRNWLQEYSLEKSKCRKVLSELEILGQKEAEIAQQKKEIFLC